MRHSAARCTHVVLIGPMGSGKSTVGAALASRLGVPLIDLDLRIEVLAGSSIPALFAREGEAGFRIHETNALQQALAEPPAVIATGGGAVLDPGNRDAMRARATVVYLQVDPALQRARLAGDTTRPLLADTDLDATLARLQAQREPLYRAAAHRVFDSGTLSPDEAADALATLLEGAVA